MDTSRRVLGPLLHIFLIKKTLRTDGRRTTSGWNDGDFIFFMLSEEDKVNEYWFTCVDVDGNDRLNNMEM